MDKPQEMAAQPQLTLEDIPPVMNRPAANAEAIHGLETIVGNPDALGQLPDSAAGATKEPQQAQTQPQQQVEPRELTVEEVIKSNEALQKYVEAERSRAVNGARQKWDNEVLAKKLEADAKAREEALEELSRRAMANDEDAIKELGKNTAAQVMQKLTEQAMLQMYSNQLGGEMEQGLKKIFGDQFDESLHPRNAKTIPDWLETVVQAKLAQDRQSLEATKQQEIEKLAEAKMVDMLGQRRQLLPVPDTTQMVAGGGNSGTPRKWRTLSEAAKLFADDAISAREYQMATQWYAENRIPFQDGPGFGIN